MSSNSVIVKFGYNEHMEFICPKTGRKRYFRWMRYIVAGFLILTDFYYFSTRFQYEMIEGTTIEYTVPSKHSTKHPDATVSRSRDTYNDISALNKF